MKKLRKCALLLTITQLPKDMIPILSCHHKHCSKEECQHVPMPTCLIRTMFCLRKLLRDTYTLVYLLFSDKISIKDSFILLQLFVRPRADGLFDPSLGLPSGLLNVYYCYHADKKRFLRVLSYVYYWNLFRINILDILDVRCSSILWFVLDVLDASLITLLIVISDYDR